MEDKEMLERLRLARGYTQRQCNKAYNKFKEAEQTYLGLRGELEGWRNKYEELDHELAEIDGRLHILKGTGKSKKEPSAPTLTMDQIKMLAEKVGIVLDLGEECDFD